MRRTEVLVPPRLFAPVPAGSLRIAVGLLVTILLASSAPAAPGSGGLHIRVDPRGGPKAGPVPVVETLDEALALLRRIRSGRPGGEPALIEFTGGTHRLAGPARIDARLSGRPGAPLILRGAADGSTRLTGSVPIAPVEASRPQGLEPGRRDRVRAYRLPAAAVAQPSIAVRRIHPVAAPPLGLELFDGAGALRPARWPNTGWSGVRMPPRPDPARETDPVLLVPPDRADGWRGETDLWVSGYLGQDWSFETIPALTMLSGTGRLVLVGQPHYPLRAGDRFFVEHALSELDEPGEWWREARRGLVWVIPRRQQDGALEVSVAASLIDLAGASHVRLEGLTLERTRGDAVVVTGGDDVVVEDCTIRWTGGRGLVFDGTTRSGLRRSVVTETGEGGVTLAGGDRAGLVPGQGFVEDSVLVRFGRLGRTYKGAVDIDGVGMRVAGNLIAHAPHLAIRFQGNDHAIVDNEIFGVVTETSDAAAIYTGRDITAQGTRLGGNFLHDIRPAPGSEVKGLYLDDMASGTTIDGNVFLRVPQPVFIGGGRDNVVTGNAFVAASPALFLDGRGEVWPGPPISSPDNSVRAAFDALPVTRPPWSTRYPRLAGLLGDEPLAPKRNVFRDNLLIGSEGPQVTQGADPRRQIILGNRVQKAPEGVPVMSVGHVGTLLAKSSFTDFAVPALDRMDRVAVLSQIPSLRRRAGPLLTRDGSP